MEIKKRKPTRNYFSPVWSYFQICEDNAVLVDCLICKVRLTRGGTTPNRCGTTNLRRHLNYAHNITLPLTSRTESVDGSLKHMKKKPLLKTSPVPKKDSATHKIKGTLKKSNKDTKKKVAASEVEEEKPVTQADPLMCIKWNTYLMNMTYTLTNLMNDEQFVDVTLACEGQSLKCHKVMLAACSPYLHHLLTSANCPHPVIMFKDFCFWELQALVTFMYSGEVSVPQSQLLRILRVAESLQIKGLAKPETKSEPTETSSCEKIPDTPIPTSTASGTKRKRKLVSHSCCKNPSKSSNFKAKATGLVKTGGKQKAAKKKTIKRSPGKKIKLTPLKKSNPKKTTQPESPLTEEDVIVPELPDILTVDMLNTDDIEEGIELPLTQMDSIFPLTDFHFGKTPGTNGSHGNDFLHHIITECGADAEQGSVR